MSDTLTTTTTVSTVPSGTIIATDDLGAAGHVQRVKLSCGPDGTATDVPVGGGVEAAALRVTLASDSTGVVSIDDNGGSLTVDGATLTTIAGAVAGTEMQVDVVAALPAGTNAIGKLAANSGVDIGDVDVLTLPGIAGAVAHDAADSGNPLKIGGKARTTNPAAVGDADRVDATFDDLGRQVIVLNQVRDLTGSQTTDIANTTETTIVTAAASTFHDLVGLVITNQTATAVVATLRDVTAGSAIAKFAIAANGGVAVNFPVPLKQTTVNTAWTLQLSAGSITVSVFAQYIKNV